MLAMLAMLAKRARSGQDARPVFVRFQSAESSPSGRYPGLFALANQLAHDGQLTTDEYNWLRKSNDWFNSAYVDPGTVDPQLFDRRIHPFTSCWFKEGAADHLLDRVVGYIDLLDRHEIQWVKLRSANPGQVLYEDDVQIVVGPPA